MLWIARYHATWKYMYNVHAKNVDTCYFMSLTLITAQNVPHECTPIANALKQEERNSLL